MYNPNPRGGAKTVRFFEAGVVATELVHIIRSKDENKLRTYYLYLLINQLSYIFNSVNTGNTVTYVNREYLETLPIMDKIPPVMVQERICDLYKLMLRYERLSKQECALIRRIRREVIKDQTNKY